ncbi:cytochrome b561 domain-containing protein 2-like [Anopheles stephensi]|uniref:cytochrome b561 domain-containing protein 2-like n=1 Tax=Anopheles stephensi TaxID=30069 RepID=UPI0007D5291D|nr:cytochrome b561 domain-containing protein 2-like [Anopheles stephensi]XP_035905430.1 cytochrome b561 domain-containing protein 2-like [Anopheles stephensi]
MKSAHTSDQNSTVTMDRKSVTENEWFFMLDGIFNTINHTMIGVVCIYTSWLCWINGFENLYTWHVFLTLIGYHLLMAEGIVLLYSGNGWTQKLTHSHKRTVHWLIEVVGCTCCVVGIALEIYFRQSTNRRHFSSTHSIVGLISLVFLALTLVNGLMALFAADLRKRIRPIYSKLSHYLTGTVCYVLGMVAIVLAYEKKIYHQNTITKGITMMTVFTIAVTVLSMVGVVKTMYNQFKTLAK